MRFRRGTSPTLYDLYHGGREIGSIRRGEDGTIVFWLDGFATATDATAAASLAHAGRLAYLAQRAPAGPVNEVRPSKFSTSVAEDSAWAAQLGAVPGGRTIHLCAGDVEVAQLHPAPADANETWSIRVPVGGQDTPEVFLLAAARRMWEAVRRAGLGVRQNA
jgi:hypothetical protein